MLQPAILTMFNKKRGDYDSTTKGNFTDAVTEYVDLLFDTLPRGCHDQ
jgi:hypothetical protein